MRLMPVWPQSLDGLTQEFCTGGGGAATRHFHVAKWDYTR